MKKILTIAAYPMLALAAPAIAAETPAVTAAGSAASSVETAGSPAAAASAGSKRGDKTYCYVMEQSTGSRLKTRKCRTKQQWLELGVDVTEKM